jgi:stage II sporulation protein AA (anti-sigma F factor antagonist)
VKRPRTGYRRIVDEQTTAPTSDRDSPGPGEPQVTSELRKDTAVVTVVGELSEAARRPLVRTLTDLLLSVPNLHRVELHLRDVTFMNSAGMAVLVQMQKLGQPRAVEVVLVEPPEAVARPLQLAGLWHRFPVVEGGSS